MESDHAPDSLIHPAFRATGLAFSATGRPPATLLPPRRRETLPAGRLDTEGRLASPMPGFPSRSVVRSDETGRKK
jgi:hypothetical protein